MRVMIYHSSIQCSSGALRRFALCLITLLHTLLSLLSPTPTLIQRSLRHFSIPINIRRNLLLASVPHTDTLPSFHHLSIATMRRLYSLSQHTIFVLNQPSEFYRSRYRPALVRLAVTGIVLHVAVISTGSGREQGRRKMPKRSKRSHGKSLLKWKLKLKSRRSRKVVTMIPKCLRVRQSQHLNSLTIIPHLHRSSS